MATSRSYGDACPIARALDVVGERWALLVVRELLLGPQRFTDLRRALVGASSNLVADRLRELEGRGVVRRRKLAAPAGSWVYELTEWGQELEPILVALGGWGAHVARSATPTTLTATSVLLFLRTGTHHDPEEPPTVYRLELDDRVWAIQTGAGQIDIQPGEPARADASMATDPETLNALLYEPAGLDAAVANGRLVTQGDLAAVRRLLQAVILTPAE